MATINDPNSASNIQRVGEVATGSTGASHFTPRPIPSSIGHYRVTHRCVLVATQAANSRIFELRNPHASNLIIPTRLLIKWLNQSAHTAIIEDSLDAYKVTGFSVLDTTNTVTLTPSLKRTSMSATNAQFRGVTATGVAAGMTGGTLTKDPGPFFQLPRILNQAVMATSETQPRIADVGDALDDDFGAHPWVLAQNEGIIIENRALLGAAAGSSVYIDCAYAEVAFY